MYEICLNLIIKTPKQGHRRCSYVLIVNFEQISYFFLVFFTVDFEHVFAYW